MEVGLYVHETLQPRWCSNMVELCWSGDSNGIENILMGSYSARMAIQYEAPILQQVDAVSCQETVQYVPSALSGVEMTRDNRRDCY